MWRDGLLIIGPLPIKKKLTSYMSKHFSDFLFVGSYSNFYAFRRENQCGIYDYIIIQKEFFEGIQYAKKGCYLNEIGTAIQKYAEQNGFSVVREYVGHGIGRKLHEDPSVANYKEQSKGVALKEGMTLAIEPMINMGSHKLKVLKDGWTAVTKDGLYAAHYENTVVITNGEPEILTLLP